MEINAINQVFPQISSVLPNQNESTGLFVSTPPTIIGTEDINISQHNAALIQAQNLINDTLQGLNPGPQNEILLNQAFTDLSFRQQLDLLAQSNVLLNEALQSLGGRQQNALLIAAEALLRQTLENFNISRQTDQVAQPGELINQTFRDLGSVPTIVPPNETIFPTFDTLTVPQVRNDTQGGSRLATTEARLSLETAIPQPEPLPQAQTQAIQAIPANVATPALTTTPVATEAIIPEPPFLIPEINPTPFGVSVYEVNKLKLTTLAPAPIDREVAPAKPVAKPGIIGQLFYGPQWAAIQQHGQPPENDEVQQPREGVVRTMISHFNEEQVSHNLPFHLVLTKNSEGLALDIYDCSDDYACHAVYDTPLTQNGLPELMDNLRHEAGFFVNTSR